MALFVTSGDQLPVNFGLKMTCDRCYLLSRFPPVCIIKVEFVPSVVKAEAKHLNHIYYPSEVKKI